MYESHRPLFDEKMQQLYDVLGRIAVLEEEIREFNQSLVCFFQDNVVQNSSK